MPLDPEMKAFVDKMAASGLPGDITATSPDVTRAQGAAMAPMLGQGPAMARVEELEIDGAAGSLQGRLYVPQDALVGLIVFYHGGGWVLGDVSGYDAVCRRLATAASCALVSVNYRTAPEHRFPAAAEDCYAALCWVDRHCASLVEGTLKLAVAGDSAGGNLAAVAALMARDRGGPKLAAQLLVFPVTDSDFATGSYTEFADGPLLTAQAMRWFWDQYVPDAHQRTDWRASPLRAPHLAGLPSAMVETAGYDPLRDEGEGYAARLRQAGVPVALRRWDGLCHGFFQMAMILPPAGRAVDDMGAGLRKLLAA